MRGFQIFVTRVTVSLGLLYLALRGINFAKRQLIFAALRLSSRTFVGA